MAYWPTTLVKTCRDPALNLSSQSLSRDPTRRRKAHKAIVLNCQAFVSGQEGKEGASRLPLSLTAPLCPSAYRGNFLTPRPSDLVHIRILGDKAMPIRRDTSPGRRERQLMTKENVVKFFLWTRLFYLLLDIRVWIR